MSRLLLSFLQRQRIPCFTLTPHEHSIVVGLESGAIRILVSDEDHQAKKIELVLDRHFFGYGE